MVAYLIAVDGVGTFFKQIDGTEVPDEILLANGGAFKARKVSHHGLEILYCPYPPTIPCGAGKTYKVKVRQQKGQK